MAALDGHQLSRIQYQRLKALVVCTCLMLAPSRSAPTPPSPVTLFHQGDDALNWDHDELVRVRKLHSADVSDVKEFLASDSVGSYLKLSPVEALHMPVPVNIVFVGFAADGNMHINITAEQMQKWFGHLDHVLPHTRVQLSELSCAEDGHCAGMVHGTVRAEPVKSYVHLNFSCNVVVTRRGELAATFERAIHVFSRPVDPEIEMGAQQVDAERMEKFVDNFLSHLGILESGYTLVVLNPTWTVSEPVYGYRLGLSQAEMDVLLANIQKVRDLLQSSYMIQEPELPVSHSGPSSWMGRLSRNQQKKFGAVDATWSGDVWVESMKSYLNMVEDYRNNMLKTAGTMSGAAALAHAATLMKRTGSPMSQVLHDELLYTDPYTSVYSKFRTMHPAEDCLVGNWVGHQRWALVDLTAGGFDWGPALGGEGVVHKHSLPSVMDHFSKLHELRKRHLEDDSHPSDKNLMADLSQQTQAHKSQKANTAYLAFSAELAAQRKSRSPDEPPLGEPQSKEDRELATRKWRNKYQETLLKAELEMNEQFAARHCAGASSSSKACMQIKDKSIKARNMLAKLAGAQASSVDVWRDLRWDVFGPEGNLEHESDEIADEAQRSRDLFLGELNGVLSRALRHVVAPPTATWTHAAGYLHDTATPFAKHVVFDIYVVRESVSISADQTSTPQFFNLAAYQDQVLRLALPGQKFEVRRHDINMHDDVVLAAAFAAAQHSIAQEIPSEPDMVQEAERIYVDTRVLSHVLRKRFTNARSPPPAMPSQSPLDEWEANEHGHPPQKEGSKNHDHYEVPVFIFELHRDYAVLLDEHYNAKALEDMILVIHNSAREDEHPTGMMCGGALLARPLSPLREALSATLTHLSGVLPPHLGYSPGRQKVQHDWLWSVGSHPHSFTSIGTTYSELQRDALARSYLLDAIDSSVDAINEGIATLTAIKPTPLVHKHIKKNKAALSELLSLWPELLAHWRSVMDSAWHLNWGVATMQLGTIEDRSLRFMHLAQQLAAVPKGGQCAGLIKPRNEHLVLPTLILSCFVGAWAVAWLIWPAVVTKRERGVNTYSLKF